MSSREICLWIDERWYNALSKRLKDESLEEHLENVLDEMCNQLPEREYKRISEAIWQEDQQSKQAQEAARRFAVFHVTEKERSTYFIAEEKLDVLQTAVRLRSYARKAHDNTSSHFAGMFSRGERISKDQFDTYVSERLENTGRVVGAYNIHLDHGTFDALHILDGWQRFYIQDVSTAAYFAMKKTYARWDERCKVFLERLDGKQITTNPEVEFVHGTRQLQAKEICFSEDIIQNDNLLEFYMDIVFDAEEVFGSRICMGGDDDFLNLYANYDLKTGRVCDTLDVVLSHDDGSEQCFKYQLSPDEQTTFLPEMESYCKHRLKLSLEECRAEYFTEQKSPTHQEIQM